MEARPENDRSPNEVSKDKASLDFGGVARIMTAEDLATYGKALAAGAGLANHMPGDMVARHLASSRCLPSTRSRTPRWSS